MRQNMAVVVVVAMVGKRQSGGSHGSRIASVAIVAVVVAGNNEAVSAACVVWGANNMAKWQSGRQKEWPRTVAVTEAQVDVLVG